ncbi:type IX secretion system protein PorQ [Lacinutrix sp. Bg11-31]|uniref:type IX secretion system protein PorQ n=1 Tax=Lacinutrix sp. Bg11-31 TaxID=2057808 RepID=UPI000C307AA4|nr:type IX secretion system protein PorQ [Lacinutrix sp. Bg11-31]AUC81638.1 penicillin-binding protein [Lacinutrix sp. Bg11-31]
MLKKIIPFSFILFSTFCFAQLGGQSTYQFLNLVSSPRQAALGGKVLTNVDWDVTQAIYNPSAINVEMDNQFALNYTSYLGGIKYGTAAYAYTVDRRVQTYHAGVTYVNYGDFAGYDEEGNETNEFSGSEIALSIGYAAQVGYSDFYVGANLKLINSNLEQYNSFGVATDLALMYRDERLEFQGTLVVRNLGTQITTYAGRQESLPLEVDIGLSQTLENVPLRWHLTFENLQQWPIGEPNPARATTDLEGNQAQEKVGFLSQVIRHTILGAELFPNKGFNVRLGYNFRRAEELRIEDQRNFSGLSAGFSVKLNKMRFSYTHAKYTAAANSNFFGLQIDLR